MTDEEKYIELLLSLAEIIKTKDTDIKIKDYELNRLIDRLSDAEKQIEQLKKGS